MESLINKKLAIAREMVNVSQRKLAQMIGVRQASISIMERKSDKFQLSIAEFYYKNGIDMNLIFDDTVSAEDFADRCLNRRKYLTGQVDHPAIIPNTPCKECSYKDDIIDSLKSERDVLRKLIVTLDKECKSVDNNTDVTHEKRAG